MRGLHPTMLPGTAQNQTLASYVYPTKSHSLRVRRDDTVPTQPVVTLVAFSHERASTRQTARYMPALGARHSGTRFDTTGAHLHVQVSQRASQPSA